MADQSLSHVSNAEAVAATGAEDFLNDVPKWTETLHATNQQHTNSCTVGGSIIVDGPRAELHKYQLQPMKWNGNGITVGVRGLTNQTCMSTGHKSDGDQNCNRERQ